MTPPYKLDPSVARAVKKGPSAAAGRLEADAPLLQRKDENAPAPNALDAYLEQMRANAQVKEADQSAHESAVAARQGDRLVNNVGLGNVTGDDVDPEAVAQLDAGVKANPLLASQQDPWVQAKYAEMMANQQPAPSQEPVPKYSASRHSFYGKSPGRFYGKPERKQASPANMELDELLKALKESAATFEYKDPSMNLSRGKADEQRYAGIGARRLEQVPNIGSGLVHDTPNGKAVDFKASISAALAAIGRQQQMIDELMKQRGGK